MVFETLVKLNWFVILVFCSYIGRNSAGYVYIRFDTIEAAMKAQRAMNMRWFARRLVSALFMVPTVFFLIT